MTNVHQVNYWYELEGKKHFFTEYLDAYEALLKEITIKNINIVDTSTRLIHQLRFPLDIITK